MNDAVDLSPSKWPPGDYARYMDEQSQARPRAGVASGRRGAVTVSYNAFAARAGLEALKQGGSAVDAALTTALTQVALTAGAPISYFGILSLVCFDARSGQVQTMNAEWNTVLGEPDPLHIPGAVSFESRAALLGRDPSGRTALVGGFMKGVEAAHRRYGRLPFGSLFQPAIELAEHGFPVTPILAEQFESRAADLSRLPETARTLLGPDGSAYKTGETFRQPALAATLKAVAAYGADYMYGGPWGERLAAAVRADGGAMTLEDLRRYQVIWADPLVAPIGAGFSLATAPWPNAGGIALVEALNLADLSGLADGPSWSQSAEALRTAVDITQQSQLESLLDDDLLSKVYPGVDFSPGARPTREHAEEIWARMQAGVRLAQFEPAAPRHSDDVVVIDSRGDIAAITHSINCVFWGKTAITVGGVTIGDPGSFQQALIARTTPGGRLPAPTETGIVLKEGRPVLGFASMGAGLHQRSFQCLLNVTRRGMSVDEAVDAPDFYLPKTDPNTGAMIVTAGEDFPRTVLEGTGHAWAALPPGEARLGGSGDWVAISRDASTGALRAASANGNNSAAVAY